MKNYIILLFFTSSCVSTNSMIVKERTIFNLVTNVKQLAIYDTNENKIIEYYTWRSDTNFIGIYQYDINNRIIQELYYKESELSTPYEVNNYIYIDELKYNVYLDDTVKVVRNDMKIKVNDSTYDYINEHERWRNIINKKNKLINSKYFVNDTLVEYSKYYYGDLTEECFIYNSNDELLTKKLTVFNKFNLPIEYSKIDVVTGGKLVENLKYEYFYW